MVDNSYDPYGDDDNWRDRPRNDSGDGSDDRDPYGDDGEDYGDDPYDSYAYGGRDYPEGSYGDAPYDDYDEDGEEFTPRPYLGRVPLWRRGAALAIDGIVAGIPSGLGNPGAQFLGFSLLWLVLRVIVVSKNRGQSLGRWALDMRVVDAEFGRVPGLLPLCKREAVLGLALFFTLEAIVNLSPQNAWVILGFLPLGLDGLLAYNNPQEQQTVHDRLADTYVVSSRRGYSLDLRLKRLLASSGVFMK